LGEEKMTDINNKRYPEPCTLVIFGATGDLTKRKLIPALFEMYLEQMLPEKFNILGVSRGDMSDKDFRSQMKEANEKFGKRTSDVDAWAKFEKHLHCCPIDYDVRNSFENLKKRIESAESKYELPGNRLFYLSVPPSAYLPIVKQLGAVSLNTPPKHNTWVRIIIEKPIGYDLESAKELNNKVSEYFSEEQVYRIDHFLGKETVQNLIAFRFANGIFEPIWNRNYIDNVQITAAEAVGVERRGGYYETSGALRDMIQNHLLQVFAHTAMEAPARFDADTFRDEKLKVFDSVKPISTDEVDTIAVRAQYSRGTINGKKVSGYLEEDGIDKNSVTETYAALKLHVDNWRWAGVPFYLRTGKRMATRVSEVMLVFKQAPHQIFQSFGDIDGEDLDANILAIRLQPDEGISLRFGAKVPGHGMKIKPVTMEFDYETAFKAKLDDAYERLLLDAMLGDAALFARRDGVEASWRIIMPVLEAWNNSDIKELPTYEAGSWGPKEAEELLFKDNCWWRKCM
jgi:glucose-6-phosphate 1-dehydrogenase